MEIKIRWIIAPRKNDASLGEDREVLLDRAISCFHVRSVRVLWAVAAVLVNLGIHSGFHPEDRRSDSKIGESRGVAQQRHVERDKFTREVNRLCKQDVLGCSWFYRSLINGLVGYLDLTIRLDGCKHHLK